MASLGPNELTCGLSNTPVSIIVVNALAPYDAKSSNHMLSKVWDELTYPYLNSNGSTVEVSKMNE